MASPRPALKRSNSKVRFSRADMSPVGTMASDSTVHGVHGQHSRPPPSGPGQGAPSNPYAYDTGQEAYGIDSYPFSEDISLSTSAAPDDHPMSGHTGGYYREVAPEDELHPHDSQSQVYESNDGYTATPPRVGGSRQWGVSQRPGLDTLLSANPSEAMGGDVSPRGSTVGGIPFENPSRAAYQGSPHARPASALRSSLVMPSHPPGSPQRPSTGAYEGDYPGSPLRGSAIRASVPNMHTPPRRMMDQHPHRGSAPPDFGSPNIGSPHYGSPRGSPNPAIRRYPEYEQAGPAGSVPDRLSPVPPYGSPRSSFNRPAAPAYGGQDREWDEARRNDRYGGRHDSDTTLQGEYDDGKPALEKKRGSNDEKGHGGKSYRRARSMSSDSGKSVAEGMRRRTTREVEDDGDSYHVKGGVFSQLLRLTGRSSTLRRRVSSRGASSMGGGAGELPTMKSLGLKRAQSGASTIFGAEELDRDDPRVTGQRKTAKRRNSWSDLPFSRASISGAAGGAGRRRASIQYHVADLLTRQQFILKLAKALMAFGAPSHRIESQLSATALVLEIDAQFIHLPSIVIASFGDVDTRTSEMHFVKTGGGLDLGKLHRVHNIYRAVVHDELDAGEGTRRIQALLKAPLEYKLWQRVCIAFLCSAIIGPMGFGGSFVDGLASGVLGILLSFLQLNVASKSAMYSNIFEISIATVVSFTARGLATTGIFCYQSVASAGVVLILPGYTILCGSLELASKNIVSGSVRMVYAIIYSLFLGFGITIGSDLFYVIDRPARRAATAAAAAAESVVKLQGQFIPTELLSSFNPDVNGTTPLVPFNGTFTFSNSTTDAYNSNLQQGNIICPRPDGLPWYRQSMPPLYLILFVPLFSILLSLWNMQPIKSRQLPVMVVISCAGYLTNTLANHYIFDRSDVVSAIGAFVIGILGNIYSRVFGGTAFTSMVTGVLFLVPSGIAAAGGLAMTNNPKHGESYSQGLIIGFRMVQVAIGITVGLFGSGLLIYSFGRKKGAALFAF